MMQTKQCQSWSAQAFNQSPDSDNQIHGDEMAKQYGFQGGLVPGVTVSAYLTHPAVAAWGLKWLESGRAHVTVSSPLYDEEAFDVEVSNTSEFEYNAKLIRPGGVVSATAEVSIPNVVKAMPKKRGDPLLEAGYEPPKALPDAIRQLQMQGCFAMPYAWGGPHNMQTYLRQHSAMPELLDPAQGGYANMSFILGLSNWVLAANTYMNPWIHLETTSQNYAAIPAGTELVVEMQVLDLFSKKGHEFLDVEVNVFENNVSEKNGGAAEAVCFSSIELRAIYKLRGQ
jgi:hypothetical protein